MTDDLLAVLIEVTSVTASGRQLKQPIKLPRPKPESTPARGRGASREQTSAAYQKGISVLASTSRRVSR